MATIYQKVGADKCLILEPGEALLREMALPSAWTEIVLAFGLSLTTAGADNANCVNETLTYVNPLSSFLVGIKDGSLIAPGRDGSRFIGVTTDRTYPATINSGELGWSRYKRTVVSNGLAFADDGGSASPNWTIGASGSGTTTFGRILLVKLAVAGASIRASSGTTVATSDFSDAAMKTAILTTSLNQLGLVAGWWTSGQTPEVRHLYLRSPFLTNRFRVHNYGYMVIS